MMPGRLPAPRRAGPAPALALALVAVAAGACGSGGARGVAASGCEPADVPEHDTGTLVVEGDPWVGYAPFRDDRLLAGTPYRTIYVEQPCQQERAADLTSGRADIAVTTLDQVLLHRPEGTVVGVIDQSRGADALVLDTPRYPWLDSVDDLDRLVEEYEDRGEHPALAYPGGSPSEVLLDGLATTTAELRLGDFDLVAVDSSATAHRLLRAGEVQLAVVAEPDTTAARQTGHEVALSSADLPGARIDVILASDRLIDEDPAAVRALIGAYYTRMDDLLAHRARLVELVAEDLDIREAAASSVVEGIKLYGTNDADVFMNRPVFPLDEPQATQTLRDIASLLSRDDPDVRLGGIAIDGSYIAEVAQTRYGAGPGTEGAAGG